MSFHPELTIQDNENADNWREGGQSGDKADHLFWKSVHDWGLACMINNAEKGKDEAVRCKPILMYDFRGEEGLASEEDSDWSLTWRKDLQGVRLALMKWTSLMQLKSIESLVLRRLRDLVIYICELQ